MALTKEGLIQELKHEIHSPLAAIRNALYLAAVRTDDPQALRYLALAHAEISRIAAVLKNANQIEENKQVHVLIPLYGHSFRCLRFTKREPQLTISSVFMHSLCCISSRLSLGYFYATRKPAGAE